MKPANAILVLGYGNPARGDDGLGPAFANALDAAGLPGVETLWDYQPSVEHAADIAGRDAVIFADASASGAGPFSFRRLHARIGGGFTSHALSPESVLALAHTTLGWRGSAYLVAVRGYEFLMFREAMTPEARQNLHAAVACVTEGIAHDRLAELMTDPPTDHSEPGGASWNPSNG